MPQKAPIDPTRPLLEVASVGKAYPKSSDGSARLRALWSILRGRPYDSLSCIDDISFLVRPGESLGIIGENGAGKSTLLKLVCGVLVPTSGSVKRQGSVGALLELGAGFDLEQTGRANIALSAGLMGWSAPQIRERSAEIIAFADIGRYLDEPVKHYSSGMVVRLGFAVIAAVRPQLLITDEVLAVGDESFQKKCIRWMEEYLETGGTLLLVSHSMYHVQKLCKHALWIHQGKAEAYGDVFAVTQDYLAYHERKSASQLAPDIQADYVGEEYRITRVTVNDSEAMTPAMLSQGSTLTLCIDIYSPNERAPHVAVGVVRADGTPVYGCSSEIDSATAQRIDPEHIRYRVVFEALPLLPGGYSLKLHAMDPEGLRLFDTVERAFVIRGNSREFGMVRLDHRWS